MINQKDRICNLLSAEGGFIFDSLDCALGCAGLCPSELNSSTHSGILANGVAYATAAHAPNRSGSGHVVSYLIPSHAHHNLYPYIVALEKYF
jgi:hypothetical protein